VREEAEEEGVTKLPLSQSRSIRCTMIPLGFRLIQAVNLAGWSGDIENAEYQHLIQSIKDKVGDPADIEKGQQTNLPKKKPSEQVHSQNTVRREARILIPTPQ
jgi:hypothetical protein